MSLPISVSPLSLWRYPGCTTALAMFRAALARRPTRPASNLIVVGSIARPVTGSYRQWAAVSTKFGAIKDPVHILRPEIFRRPTASHPGSDLAPNCGSSALAPLDILASKQAAATAIICFIFHSKFPHRHVCSVVRLEWGPILCVVDEIVDRMWQR